MVQVWEGRRRVRDEMVVCNGTRSDMECARYWGAIVVRHDAGVRHKHCAYTQRLETQRFD